MSTLYLIRVSMFLLGLIAIIINSIRYTYYIRKCRIKGIVRSRSPFTRIAEFIIHNLLYAGNRVYLVLLVVFHSMVFLLALAHIGLYIKSLYTWPIADYMESTSQRYIGLALSISMGISGILLLILRLVRRRKGLARLKASIIVLHSLAQLIAWSWAVYYLAPSTTILLIAIMAIEMLHVYVFTWVGFHGITYIIRLYYASKILRQSLPIEL